MGFVTARVARSAAHPLQTGSMHTMAHMSGFGSTSRITKGHYGGKISAPYSVPFHPRSPTTVGTKHLGRVGTKVAHFEEHKEV